MKTKKKGDQGFTLIELLVVITIMALLMSMAVPAYNTIQVKAAMNRDASNIRQILIGCSSFASDWDGLYPSFDPDKTEGGGEEASFSSSNDAFNVLIPQYIDTESIFWYAMKPDKLQPPREDGNLEAKECTYVYVSGLTNTSFSRSPLVADAQESAGTYGENHPWLNQKKAVVGYVGGNVATETLTSAEAGATVRTKDGQIKDIFQKRSGGGEEGGGSGGLLDTDTSNILLPGGG